MTQAELCRSSLDENGFTILKNIGEGSSCLVSLVKHKTTTYIYASKTYFGKKHPKATNDFDDFYREILAMSTIPEKAPFLPVSLEHILGSSCHHIIMPYYRGGSIEDLLNNRGKLSEQETRFYTAELILALETLHKVGIAHCDIKPGNILLDTHGHVVLSDFGYSQTFAEKNIRRGTEGFYAPELRARKPYTIPITDFWSLGAFIWDCLQGHPPTNYALLGLQRRRKMDGSEFLEANRRMTRLNLSPDCDRLLQGLLEKKPSARLSDFVTVKSHPWFNGINWKKVASKKLDPPYFPSYNASVFTISFEL